MFYICNLNLLIFVFFIRGGLTIGEVYFRDNTLFGPRIIQAYQLESQTAIFPRVIVPKEAVEMVKEVPALKAFHNSVQEELEEIKGLLQYDKEEFYFIDYINAGRSEILPPNFLAFLANHKTTRRYIQNTNG